MNRVFRLAAAGLLGSAAVVCANGRATTASLQVAKTRSVQQAADAVPSRGAEGAATNEQAKGDHTHAELRPHCTTIRFTGVAVGYSPYDLDGVREAKDPSRLLAMNPLECGPSGITQTFVCHGADVFTEQPAYTISWGKTWLQIVTPLDLADAGTRATMLYIDRKNARCTDNKPPASLPSDNLDEFFRSPHDYR